MRGCMTDLSQRPQNERICDLGAMIPLVQVVFHMGYKSTVPGGTVLWKCSLRIGHSARDDRQRDAARVLLAVMDRLMRDDALLPLRRRDNSARVRVAIEAREVARRDL